MKRYIKGQFTISYADGDGVPVNAVTAILSQLKPGAVIDDAGVDPNGPFTGARRLIINDLEPAEGSARNA